MKYQKHVLNYKTKVRDF